MRVTEALGAAAIAGALIVAALMGAYVPLRLFKMVEEGELNALVASVFSAIGVIAGAAIAFFAVVVGIPILMSTAGEGAEMRLARRELEERVTAYRARQRAIVEELDEVKRLLEEIRDLLREGMGA